MNYWLLTSEYPPFFGGGISTYCYYTAQMLVEKGHTVTVFTNDATVKDIDVSTHDGVRIVRFNPDRTQTASFLGHVTNISYAFAHTVRHFIEKEGAPHLIEAQEYLGIAYYLLQYKHLLYDWCKDVPVLITMHSPSFLYMEYNHVPIYRYPNYWICEMERFCLQAANHIISPSQFMVNELHKRFALTNHNISIVPNPFSAKGVFEKQEQSLENEIVFYGKLTLQKGAFKLMAYFKELWDKGFTRPLFLLGGQDIVYHPEGKSMGDLIRTQYKKYIDEGLLKLEDRIPPAGIAERLSRAELVIIPSCNDNLPYVVFEMMALGKVLLVSKQGGQVEVIEDGVDGFVFDHEQPQTFEEQLLKILQLDKTEREKIKGNAIQKVSGNYSLNTIYKQKIDVLESLVGEKRGTNVFPFTRHLSNSTDQPQVVNGIKDLLSIVIPYYNMGKFVDETIQSVLAIKYPHKEIIIINDGSNDPSSLAKLNDYRSVADIKVIDTENKGLAHARNYGAQIARGEFLAFLDADDKVDAFYYSKAIRVMKAYQNVHFVGGWTAYFEGSHKIWPTFMPEPPIILYHNMVNSSALVYKRSAFVTGGVNATDMDFQGWEDYESVIALLNKGFRGVVLPEPVFHYRVRANSMIRGISKSKKLLLYQYISNKYHNFYATFAADIFNLVNANGSGFSLDNPSLDYHLADKVPFGGQFSMQVIKVVKRNKHIKRLAYRIYRLVNK